MDCLRPSEEQAENYSYTLRFEWQEWDVIKAAARERTWHRKTQSFKPYSMDGYLTDWDEARGMLVGDTYPDALATLLDDFGRRTDEEAATIGQEAARVERQALGERALAMITELKAAVEANDEAQTMSAELAELFGAS